MHKGLSSIFNKVDVFNNEKVFDPHVFGSTHIRTFLGQVNKLNNFSVSTITQI